MANETNLRDAAAIFGACEDRAGYFQKREDSCLRAKIYRGYRGKFDKITCPIYPSGVKIDRFAELDTGHLSVLDSPELISRLILSGE